MQKGEGSVWKLSLKPAPGRLRLSAAGSTRGGLPSCVGGAPDVCGCGGIWRVWSVFWLLSRPPYMGLV